jgi:hypothetical protein
MVDVTVASTTNASTPDIDLLVYDLRSLYYGAGLELMVRVGSLIVDRLYYGDASRWQSHGRKDTSFRKLAKHPDLPFQASTLSRAVGIYLLAQRSPAIAKFERVGPSHLQEVLGLAHHEQVRLLELADAEAWPTRRLRAEVRALQSTNQDHTPPKKLPAFQRCLMQWRKPVEERALLSDLESIHHLEANVAVELLNLARALCQQSEALARQLSMRLTAAERSSPRRTPTLAQAARPSGAAPQHSSSVRACLRP